MIVPTRAIEEVRCSTAEDLLDQLNLRNTRWRDNPEAFLFRGQGDASWHLVPKAIRPDVDVWYTNSHKQPPHPDPLVQKLGKALVQVVYAPAAGNPNLRAQSGVFTVIRRVGARGYPSQLSLDEYAQQLVAGLTTIVKTTSGAANGPVLWKLVLPATEAPKLLRLLYGEEVYSGSMFPGYVGSADALQERFLWDDASVRPMPNTIM